MSGLLIAGLLGGGGGGLGGGLLGAGFSALAAHKAWKRQKAMMRNAIQWRVDDMKAAGINPILAVSGGMSGGGGGSAPMATTPKFGGVGDVISTAKQAKTFKPGVSAAKSQAEAMRWNATRAQHDSGTAGMLFERSKSEAVKAGHEALRAEVGLGSDVLELERAELGMVSAREVGEFDKSGVGRFMRKAGRFLEPLGRVFSPIRSEIPRKRGRR